MKNIFILLSLFCFSLFGQQVINDKATRFTKDIAFDKSITVGDSIWVRGLLLKSQNYYPYSPSKGMLWNYQDTIRQYNGSSWVKFGSGGGGSYTLPTASTTVLGGVKVDGTTININGSGVISATGTTMDTTGLEQKHNKSSNTSLGTSNLLYPTQGAVKTYADTKKANNDTTTSTGYVRNWKHKKDSASLKTDILTRKLNTDSIGSTGYLPIWREKRDTTLLSNRINGKLGISATAANSNLLQGRDSAYIKAHWTGGLPISKIVPFDSVNNHSVAPQITLKTTNEYIQSSSGFLNLSLNTPTTEYAIRYQGKRQGSFFAGLHYSNTPMFWMSNAGNSNAIRIDNGTGDPILITKSADASELFKVDATGDVYSKGVKLGSGGGAYSDSIYIPTSNHYSGTKIAITAGENLSYGDLVYLNSNGKYYKANASSSTTIPALFMCVSTINTNNTGTALVKGIVNNSSWTLTTGSYVYLSTVTNGGITNALATSPGMDVQKVGITLNTNTIILNIDLTIIEL